jgi:hypothetical protein
MTSQLRYTPKPENCKWILGADRHKWRLFDLTCPAWMRTTYTRRPGPVTGRIESAVWIAY